MSVYQKLQELGEKARECRKCSLCERRNSVVFGQGSPEARMMIVGEAPGAQEDREGKPFIGASGRVINRLLELHGLGREEVYITNIVKCRPPRNRDPEKEEAESCSPYLHAQIQHVQPDSILAVGKFAARFLTGEKKSVKRMRGKDLAYRYGALEIPVVVAYHPAYAMREQRREIFIMLRDDFRKAVKKAYGKIMVKRPEGAKDFVRLGVVDTGKGGKFHIVSCACPKGAGTWHEMGNEVQCPTCEKTTPLHAIPAQGA